MGNISGYRIKDDSDHFILVNRNRSYYIREIYVTRPDWDYRIAIDISTRNGTYKKTLTTVPLSEDDFFGKKLSEILEKHLPSKTFHVKKWDHSNIPSVKLTIDYHTATNKNLLLIL